MNNNLMNFNAFLEERMPDIIFFMNVPQIFVLDGSIYANLSKNDSSIEEEDETNFIDSDIFSNNNNNS